MKIPKPVTAANAAASKRNGAKSTGPKSPRGKFFSSRNSITLGIFAREILLPGESQKEWEELRSEMIHSYGPVGSRERRLVEKLLWSEWRLKRLRRGETGAVAKLLADHEPKTEIAACTHLPGYMKAVETMRKLEQIEKEIDSEGNVSNKNVEWLRALPYEGARDFVRVINIAQPEPDENARPNPEMSSAAESPQSASPANVGASEEEIDFRAALLLSALGSFKGSLGEEQLYHGQFIMQRAMAQRNVLLIPQDAALDLILRYETHLLRNIERDENALERVQRLRRGEKVPPPSTRTS